MPSARVSGKFIEIDGVPGRIEVRNLKTGDQECIMEGASWPYIIPADLILWSANKERGHKFYEYVCHKDAVTARFDDGEYVYKKDVPTLNKSSIPDSVVESAKQMLIAGCPYHVKELNAKLRNGTAGAVAGPPAAGTN